MSAPPVGHAPDPLAARGNPPAPPPQGSLKGKPVKVCEVLTPGMITIGVIWTVALVSLLVVGALMAKGIIPSPHIYVTGGLIGVPSLLTVVGVPLFIYFVREELKAREKAEQIKANKRLAQHPPPPVDPLAAGPPPAAPGPASSTHPRLPVVPSSGRSSKARKKAKAAPKAPPPPVDPAEWQRRVGEEKVKPLGLMGQSKGCNLDDPAKLIADPSGLSYPMLPILQIPLFGNYEENGFQQESCSLVAKLPPGQMDHYPASVKAWCKERELTAANTDCFFMVFDNKAKDTDGDKAAKVVKRNLGLHAMALPEYDMASPSVPKGEPPADVTQEMGSKTSPSLAGLSTRAQMALFKPEGVASTSLSQIANASDDPKKRSVLRLYCHGERGKAADISFKKNEWDKQHRAEFTIDRTKGVSSAFFAAKFRGRGVVIHALFHNHENDDAGKALKQALEKDTMKDFIAEAQKGGHMPDEPGQVFA